MNVGKTGMKRLSLAPHVAQGDYHSTHANADNGAESVQRTTIDVANQTLKLRGVTALQ